MQYKNKLKYMMLSCIILMIVNIMNETTIMFYVDYYMGSFIPFLFYLNLISIIKLISKKFVYFCLSFTDNYYGGSPLDYYVYNQIKSLHTEADSLNDISVRINNICYSNIRSILYRFLIQANKDNVLFREYYCNSIIANIGYHTNFNISAISINLNHILKQSLIETCANNEYITETSIRNSLLFNIMDSKLFNFLSVIQTIKNNMMSNAMLKIELEKNYNKVKFLEKYDFPVRTYVFDIFSFHLLIGSIRSHINTNYFKYKDRYYGNMNVFEACQSLGVRSQDKYLYKIQISKKDPDRKRMLNNSFYVTEEKDFYNIFVKYQDVKNRHYTKCYNIYEIYSLSNIVPEALRLNNITIDHLLNNIMSIV